MGMERRLAAILAADVVGYSRLIRADEEGTIAALKALRASLIDPLISKHNGRIVKLMGDGMLVEFASVVDAVRTAVETQAAVARHNAGLPEDKRIEFRVGINLGDVVIDGDDIHGDGVNVAARLEGIAEPGGICVSDKVYEEVRDRLDVAFEDLGEQEVKNIDRPVRVWRWSGAEGAESTVTASEPLQLPDKPSIAILPFDNMSGDQEQEYFSDGVTEDLTTALSRFDWLFVIARNSAFSFKGKSADVRQVGRELGVRYVLEGSVRRAGSRVRINAQLIEAESDRHVWAERYDREMDDVFELQDDIVASIATIVGPEITFAEIERVRSKRPETLDAWDHYLRAVSAYNKLAESDMSEAVAHLRKAIEIESDFTNAYAQLALCHVQIGVYGWVRPVREAYAEARRMAEAAIRLAPSAPESNHALAFVLMSTGEAEAAVLAAKRAIERNPNYAEAYATLGHALIFCGELEDGLDACQRALRGNPRDVRGTWLHDAFGHAHFMLGEYEKAIEASIKARQQNPSAVGALLTLAGSHAYLGNSAEAKSYVEELLRLVPRFSLRALAKNPMFVKPELIEKMVDSMRLAGLPE
jgi:adenylate cyclase